LKAGAAVGGGLMIGAYLPQLAGSGNVSAAGAFEPNVWVRVNADDTVRIMLTQLEMGQGIMTALPMLVAEELDIDWKNVRTEWVGADRRYGNPGMGGLQMTAGSNSVRGYWKPMREAGATARAMLVLAAAKGWGVDEGTCSTESGQVVHKASGRRVRYGALVDQAAKLPIPKQVPLKSLKEFRIAGKPLARLDVPEKVNGTAMFGIDVKRPNMLVARIARSPVFGGKVKTVNADKAKAIPGVRQVVPVSAGIAVVADDFFAANRGVQALEIVWDDGPLAKLTSAEITRQMASRAEQPGAVARNDGDTAAALSSGARTFERVFEVPFLAHACMEPMNCTADVRADGCDVWVPTQAQTASLQAATAASGLPEGKVQIHTTYMGGGFGRRGEADFVTDAVEASKAVGRPVKVVWTREDDIQHDFYRPATYIRIWGAVDASGKIVAWQQRIIQQSLLKRVNPQGLAGSKGVDFISVDGAATLPYDIPNLRVEYTEFDPGIPYGFWRSVGNSVNGYVTEAFFDELAAAAGKDPFELRRQLLVKKPRHKAVLEKVAEMANWSKPVASGRARGIAVHEAFGSIVGLVTEVSVTSGAVRVHKIDCAVDCGWTINPDTIKAQMEGGIVYGLAAALKGEITIQNGRVVQGNFNNYQMLRHNEMPVIEVAIMQNEETPGGIGEPSTAAVAGSLVNAVSAATGKRIYKLPIRLA
jgi:isoquinoline 1-oxidoreductase beta subunit